MAKNYSSSDSEIDLFITQHTFINDNYNLDVVLEQIYKLFFLSDL